MQDVGTPLRSVRQLRFSTPGNLATPSPTHPSPYTPFSGCRSGFVPSGTPQLANSRPPASTVASDLSSPLSPDSAEAFVSGGLDTAMRTSSFDILTAIRKSHQAASAEAAAAFRSETLANVEAQLSTCTELLDARVLHAHTRRQLRALHAALLVDHASWLLIDTAWRAPELRSRDLTTRRLAPDLLDTTSPLEVPGYVTTQRIVEWLERSADEALERAGGPRVKPLDDPAYRWEYTAAGREDGEPVSMDFPQRADGNLDEVERKAEVRLSREIFRLVRAGRLEEAEEVCRRVGQPWRAAALGGGKRGSALSANGIKGHARKTWRMAAAAIAKSSSPGITAHERAVYGVFSGVLEPVLAVSTTYEDQAWARLSVLLDTTAERVLEGGSPDSVKIEDSAILQAFRECEHVAEGPESIDRELLEGVRNVRAYVGVGPTISTMHLSELLESCAQLAENGARKKTEWICRFAAHVCIYLKLSGLLQDILERPSDMANFDTAIESYVRLVIEMDLDEEEQASQQGTILPARVLVFDTAARYLAELTSQERVIGTYSELLCAALRADLAHEKADAKRVGVTPRDVDVRRTLCLEKAGQCFQRETLNHIVIAATDLVWSVTLPEGDPLGLPSTELESHVSVLDEITDEDELVVRAIEFLIFPAFADYGEALMRVTKAARRFFLRGKRAAARRLIEWFPSEIVSQISSQSFSGAIHELNSWRVYMDAVAFHNVWNIYHSSQRPMPISDKIRAEALAQPGEVSYDVQASAGIQLEQYVKESEEFQRESGKRRKAAVDSLRAALLFDGGWMQNGNVSEDGMLADGDDEMEAPRRGDEIRAVRLICIPQLAVLLHHVLHESGMYSEAISLAEIIADDGLKLYEYFGPSELRSFLTRIADSTVLFADDSIRSGKQRRPYEGTLFEEITSKE